MQPRHTHTYLATNQRSRMRIAKKKKKLASFVFLPKIEKVGRIQLFKAYLSTINLERAYLCLTPIVGLQTLKK